MPNAKKKGRVDILSKIMNSTKIAAATKDADIKKKKNKKIAAGIIGAAVVATVVLLVLVFVFDLGPVRPIKSTEEEARVVGTIAGYDVRYEELRYVTLTNREMLDEKYGSYDSLSASDRQAYDEELEALVLKDLKSNYSVLSLCEKYGVDTDTRDVRKHVKRAIVDLVDEIGGKEKYKAWLEKNNLTDSFLRLMYKVEYLEALLVDKLTENGDEIKYNEDNLYDFVEFVYSDASYVKVIHAFYPKDWEYSDGRDAKAHADEALAEILANNTDKKRFSAMKSAIGNAPFVSGYSVMGSDYYITYGQMHKKYESVAFSLDEYEASRVIELDEGYYILMRVPKERDQIGLRANEFLVNYRYAVLKQIADEHKETISFDGNEYFDSLDLSLIK